MSATATVPPPASTPPVVTLTPADYRAEYDLYQLLLKDVRFLGRHGATPQRRAAAGRVELRLLPITQELAPHIGG